MIQFSVPRFKSVTNSNYARNNRLKNYLTLENIAQTNVILRLIGAQQKTYRARSDNGICCTMSARNLKSSVLHIKYRSSTVLNERNMSWETNGELNYLH